MVEPIQAPEPTQDVTPTEPVVETPQEDIVTRASKVNVEPTGPEVTQQTSTFDPKDIEKIQDPQAREFAQKAYNELNRGYQAKFRELADDRKNLEDQANPTWTPERLAAELKKDDFLSSANFLNSKQANDNQSGGELTNEQWSTLSPEEQQKVKQLENNQTVLQSQLSSMLTQQEDVTLKTRYANYEPQKVNKLYTEMQQGQHASQIREHIWKVADYDDAVNRAYKLGKEDRQLDMTEKAGALSSNGVNTTTAHVIPVKGAKESTVEFFKRLAISRGAK